MRGSDLFWCLVVNVCFVAGFNIETFNYAMFRTPPSNSGSMFGFTVALHKEDHQRPWILVGAPEYQSAYQPDVINGGAVFKCRTGENDSCEEIPFDTEGNRYFGQNQLDNKTMQWFGATLSTSGSVSGPIVACAPRYVWFTRDFNRIDPVGTCYVSDGHFRHSDEYSPCRTVHWGYHRQGSCQAGFSAAINSVGDRLYIGAPGSYYWQGSVYQQSLETRPAAFSTTEGTAEYDDSYMGYSTIVGDFQSTGEQGIVVGMPRGTGLQGKVLFFTWNLTNYKNISSTKIGSYFGYSLAAADVDGDKRLDLIVGAPMHTEPNNEGKYDVGRVYVFYNSGGFFNTTDILDGANSKARFGHSLSTLGDLNRDGYDDFVVGAPYDGKNGRGAVYIYYGSSEGVRLKYGQVIYAEDLNVGYPVTTFGFSVTGGLDMDGNEYPDMGVGAYLSDTAFFFRARPVVKVDAFVKFNTEGNQIDLKQKNCNLLNGQRGTCTSIDFCVMYSGIGIPRYINLDLQYILDTKKIGRPRMFFVDHDTSTFNDTLTLQIDNPQICRTKKVYVMSDIRDKLTPLEAEVKYHLTEDRARAEAYGRRDPNSFLTPTLDLNAPPSKKDSISIQKNCGSDNVCIPNLAIRADSNVQEYLLGSDTNIMFDVVVSNHGEDAFETTLQIKYPEGVYYKKHETREGQHVLCSPLQNNTIECQIGNPLQAGKIVELTVLFQPYYKEGMPQSYEFDMSVNSTNPEKDTYKDNNRHFSIKIWIDSKLDLLGVSYPKEVQYNSSRYTAEEIRRESDIGPQVTHVYNLINKGPATIDESEIFILWPYQTLADKDFLYLLDQPHTLGNVKCEPTIANYKNYELERHSKTIWDRLKIDANAGGHLASELGGTISKAHSSGAAQTDVKIEQGSGIRGTQGGAISTSKLNKEIGSSGDGSIVHKKRQNETYTYISTKPTIKHTTEEITSRWNSSYINGVPYITFTNTTIVRDSKGNVINNFTRSNTVRDYNFQRGGQYQPKIIYTSTGGNRNQGATSYSISGGAQGGQSSASHGYSQGSRGQSRGGTYEEHRESGYSIGGSQHQGQSQGGRANVRYQGGAQGGSYEARQESSYSGGSRQGQAQTGGGDVRYQGGSQGETSYTIRNRSRTQEGSRQGSGSGTGGRYESHHQTGYTERGGYNQGQGQTQSGSFNVRYQGQGGQPSGVQDGGTYESHHETSYVIRQNQDGRTGGSRQGQTQAGGGNVRYHEQAGGGGVQDGRTYDSRHESSYSITGGSQTGGQRQQHGQVEEDSYEEDYEANYGGATSGQYGQYDSRQGGYSHGHASYGGKTLQDNVIQHGGHRLNQSSESRSGTTSFGDFVVSGDNFAEKAALGHGFTFNTVNLDNVHGQAGQSKGNNDGNYRETWHREETIERTGEIPPVYFNTVARDNVPTDKPDLNNLHRGRRQVVYDDISKVIQCNTTKCIYIKCTVGSLVKDQEVVIALRSRINMRVLREVNTQTLKFSSMAAGRISKLPYVGRPTEQLLHTHEIFTEVPAQESEIKPYVIPLWVVVLAAVGGTLALLLIIFLLYKCGFFKRNRPPTAPERQPLNRNGYHHGDEAL
ncbi:integrin alpha-PS2 isoform X2 [Aethina tumida]|uniref:integrin alpha-PS2 isoform X2 n=1 Tax=Aethina tumida TaxID=116153 RepID=UPI00096B2398|nr:integrin alpha-PS2 isoform X2 [Aethina tumida]